MTTAQALDLLASERAHVRLDTINEVAANVRLLATTTHLSGADAVIALLARMAQEQDDAQDLPSEEAP